MAVTSTAVDGADAAKVAHHLVLAHYYPGVAQSSQGGGDGQAGGDGQGDNTVRVLELLGELAAASRTEPGNVGYEFYAPGSTPGEILIVERYVSAQAFADHRESAHFHTIGKEQIIPLLDNRSIEEFSV